MQRSLTTQPAFIQDRFLDRLSGNSAHDCDFLFTGRRYDIESGFYHYRYRYYHATLGRFIGRDVLRYVDGMSLYQYGRSIPVRFTDPFGLATLINARRSTEYFTTAGGRVALSTMYSSARLGWWGLLTYAAAAAYYVKRGKDSRRLNDRYTPAIGKCPRCALIWVHGFHNDLTGAASATTSVEVGYRRAGGKAEVYGFAWNSNPGKPFFYATRRAADQVGTGAFTTFLRDFKAKCPDTTICVGAHSLGSRVALRGTTAVGGISSVLLVAAAVDNESLEPGEEFGAAPQFTDNIYVAYNDDDDVLGSAYVISEFDSALGSAGAENPEALPRNVRQRDFEKDFGDDHSAVYDEDKNTGFWRHYGNQLKCP